jgi:hypothetical protein
MPEQSKKVLCAVSHANQDPWMDIWQSGQIPTWQTWKDSEDFKIINFFGRKPNRCTRTFDRIHEAMRWSNRYLAGALRVIDGFFFWPLVYFDPKLRRDDNYASEHSTYTVNFIDTFVTYRWKILSLIQYFLEETEFDYLYVTSSSSYIRPKVLIDFVDSLPDTKVYLGPLPYEGADFVSGSSRLISRDVAELLWKHRRDFQFSLIEDKAMAKLLHELNVHPSFVNLVNITSVQEANEFEVEDFKKNYHFRLKTIVEGARADVQVMRALHAKFGDEFLTS